MHSMAIDRRQLLTLFGAGLLGTLPLVRADGAGARRLYLGGHAAGGSFAVGAFDAAGAKAFEVPMPGRGHSFADRPGRAEVVHFARRPGTFARVIDVRRGTVAHAFETPPDRHFYGHGVFSPDGRLLYAAENDFEAGRGAIGVYDAADGYGRVGELGSHGIGPHDVRLLSDGATLVVANGGIRTHPDMPRVKLNIPTMAPSLVYLDRRDGRLIEEVRLAPERHLLGIRHLAVAPDDTVAFAMQYEGPAGDVVPLVGTHRPGGEVRLFEGPEQVLRAMENYCGSAAFDPSGRVLGVSAPRGNVMTFWEATTGRHLASVTVPDGCGIAPGAGPGAFMASSGQGGAVAVEAESGSARPLAGDFVASGHWDNHLLAVEL